MKDKNKTKEQLINELKGLRQYYTELKSLSRNVSQNLKESGDAITEKRLEFLLANCPAVIYTCEFGENWAGTFMSENIKEVFGYEASDFIDNPNMWVDGIHPEDRERVFANLDNLINNDYHAHEYRFCLKDGTYRWVYDEIRVVRDQQGNPLECIGYWTDISERKRMEEKLSEREQHLQTIIETEPECVKILSPDGILIEMNAAGLAMIEAESLEQVVGQPIYSLVSPEHRDAFRKHIESVYLGNKASFEFEITGLKGTRRWLDAHSVPLSNAKNEIIGVLGITRDITEHKHAQEAMQRSHQIFKFLADYNELSAGVTVEDIVQTTLQFLRDELGLKDCSIAILSKNRDIFYLKASTHSKELGFNRGFSIPVHTTVLSEVIKENQARYRPDIKAENSDYEIDERLLKAGYRSDFLVPLWVGNECLGTLNIAKPEIDGFTEMDRRLITVLAPSLAQALNNAKLFDSLQESEERYRTVVEDMPAMICRFLADGTLTFVNKEYCRYFNKRSEEIINQNFFQFIPESDQEKIRNHYLSLGKENPMVTYEHQAIAPDGRLRWQLWTDRALLNDRGQVTEYQSIGRDITDQKKLEEELLRSQKLESVGILAGGIAHDFNNLITAILSNIYLSKKYLDPGLKAFERLETAEKALTKAGALTLQLLTFSRGGSPVKRTMSLAGVIKDSAGFALSGSNVTYELDITDNLWLVDADEGQINQVIHNIIMNADQSMPEGGFVKIYAENTVLGEEAGIPLQEGRYVKINITDKGIGISKEHLQKVFDPYFTTKHKGSGLGLAMSYSIVKNHNGYISVESEVGDGTTFTIYLPASEKQITEEKPSEKRLIPGEGRILIMDDEEFVRNALGEMLIEIGYEVDSAGDGAGALRKYEKAIKSSRPFDAVILDLTIPGGMGGKNTIKRLREVNPGIKAIVSSGYSDDHIMANFRAYGFSDVLSKPYNPEKLSYTLHKVLKGSGN